MKLVNLTLVCGLLSLVPLTGWAQSVNAPTLDASHLLPPPPQKGSARAVAELEELRHLQATSTPEQLKAAAYDDGHEDGTIFTAVLGPDFDLTKLPATAHMIDTLRTTEDEVSTPAKSFFHRDRPWIVDPAIKTCTTHKTGPATNSYPSGHATIGFAMADVLATLMPDKAQAILARASLFAENRLICGYHFRSDIVAGQEMGTVMALELMQTPAFQAQMAAAKTELHAAKLIP
jgi:acid phosphatase (class A)